MSPKLYLRFPQSNSQYPVLPEQEVIVGRTTTCDVDLTHYLEGPLKTVSRQHFKIGYHKGEGFAILDLSHNGTQVNDISLILGEWRILRNGDVIKLANNDNFMMKVVVEADPDMTDTVVDPEMLLPPVASEAESELYFDQTKSQFMIDRVPIPHEHLTKLEVVLLKYLCGNEGRLCSFDAIAVHVWADPGWAPENNTISRVVGNLRKKLDQISPGAGNYIHNIRGQGYKLDSKKPS